MGKKLEKVNPGEALTAAKWNDLIDFILGGGNITGGPGVNVSRNSTGVLIALAAAFGQWVKLARIKRVYGMEGSFVEDVRYDWQVMGEGATASRQYQTPDIGRIYASGPAITPCKVGDPCFILQLPTVERGEQTTYFGVLTEKVLGRRCSSSSPNPDPLPVIGPNGQPMPPVVVPPDPTDPTSSSSKGRPDVAPPPPSQP